MKENQISEAIGKTVTVNPDGDIGIDPDIRRIIGKESRVIKRCKSGLVQIECEGKLYSIPLRNLDLIVSNEQDKPIFGNEMKSTASEQTGEHLERVLTPDEVAARFGGQDPLLDDISAVHKGLLAYRHDLIDQHIRENAKPKGQILDDEEDTEK